MDNIVSRVTEAIDTKPVESIEKGRIDIVTIDKKTDIKPPLDKYIEVKGKPYSADYFNIDCWNELTPEMDGGIRKKVDFIEKYVNNEIKDRDLQNTTDTYDNIISKIKSELRLDSNMLFDKVIDRIYEYIKVEQKQKKLNKERKSLWENIRPSGQSNIY